MRVLTVVGDLGLGGVQRGAQEYARGYARYGWPSAVLAVDGGGPRAAALAAASVPTFVGGAAGAGAVERAAAWRPDVVHLHSYGPVRASEGAAVEGLLDRLPVRPVVLETASFGKVDYRQRYAFADVTLLLSRWALWRWEQWTRPLRPRPVGAVVPLTVDPGAFYPGAGDLRARHGVPADAVVVGSVARPDPLKWAPLLLDGLVAAAEHRPDVRVLVVGPTAEAEARLRTALGGRLVALPARPDDAALRSAYSAIDVFLHASPIGETFGLVFVEALACGTPVVTVATPHKNNSQLEVVGHGRGGLVAADRRGYLRHVRRLVDDAALRERLARDGRAHVLAHFTLDRVVPALAEVARAVRASPDRAALRAALRAVPGLATHVPTAEVDALLAGLDGRVGWASRALKRLVHVPSVHRAMVAARS